MFNPDEITAEVVSKMLYHFQLHTGAMLFLSAPNIAHIAPAHPLEQSPIRNYIATLCKIVNDQPERSEALASAVMGITQKITESLCKHAWAQDYDVPAAFWKTQIGALILAAQLWAQGDALITLSEAARILRGSAEDRDLRYVNRIIKERNLTVSIDPTEPNPQRARRVRRSEVEALRDE